MYDAKQLRLWLMVIPFWVIHFLGASFLFSQNEFINIFRESNSNESFLSQEFEDLPCSEFLSLVNNGFNDEIERVIESKLAVDTNIENLRRLGSLVAEYIPFDSLLLCERQDAFENRFTGDVLDSESWYEEDTGNYLHNTMYLFA